MLQTPTEQQNFLLPAFLSPELVDRYRRAAVLYPNDWQAAFMKTFEKLERQIKEAFSLDNSRMSIEDLLEKVEEMTDEILKMRLDRASIFRSILMSALQDPELKLSLIHISEPTRRTPISYAVFCLKKKK